MEFVVVTGLSGAGKTRAMHTFEDIGYYCVDNIPPALISVFYDLCEKGSQQRVAIVTDIRGGSMFNTLLETLLQLKSENKAYKLLFLDAADSVLINRYKETRRRHPFADRCSGSTEQAVMLERELLKPIKELSDYVIDTSMTTPAQLQSRIIDLFLKNCGDSLHISCTSFGFKFGIPADSDLVFDVRFLPNPYYVPELKNRTGLEDEVYRYVMDTDVTREFLQHLTGMMDYLIPRYIEEGKSELVVAIGCTGGHHRSVSVARYLCGYFCEKGYTAGLHHRDIYR